MADEVCVLFRVGCNFDTLGSSDAIPVLIGNIIDKRDSDVIITSNYFNNKTKLFCTVTLVCKTSNGAIHTLLKITIVTAYLSHILPEFKFF